MYIIFLVIFVLFILITNCVKRVEASKVYIIERNGKFFKTIDSSYIFLIPFIDKIKNIIDIGQQYIKGVPQAIILKSGKVIIGQIDVIYHIVDPIKATYEVKNLKSDLEYLEKNLKFDLKNDLNIKSYNWGCIIDDVNIKLFEHYSKNKSDNPNEIISK